MQEDLTADDHLVENTEKVFAADDELPFVTQDPTWVPTSVVDENGQR
jgi:hypothetical protein